MNELTIQTHWLMQNAVHGIQLQVFEKEIASALQILSLEAQTIAVDYPYKTQSMTFIVQAAIPIIFIETRNQAANLGFPFCF